MGRPVFFIKSSYSLVAKELVTRGFLRDVIKEVAI